MKLLPWEEIFGAVLQQAFTSVASWASRWWCLREGGSPRWSNWSVLSLWCLSQQSCGQDFALILSKVPQLLQDHSPNLVLLILS